MSAVYDTNYVLPYFSQSPLDYSNYSDDVVDDNVTSLQDGGATAEYWLDNWCSAFEFSMSTVVIGFLCVVGITGNILSVFVLGMDKQHRVAAFLLQVLAVSDTMVLVVSAAILSGIVGPSQIPWVIPRIRYGSFCFMELQYMSIKPHLTCQEADYKYDMVGVSSVDSA